VPRILLAIALCFVGCLATAGAFAENVSPSVPVDVRIVSAPKVDDSSNGLLMATWIMVVANVLLCGVTWMGARNQSKDMRDSIAVGEKSAEAAGRSADAAVRSSDAASASAQLAARQQREILERETNIVAHRVAMLAARVRELVTLQINLSHQVFRDFDSTPEKQKLDNISGQVQQATDDASAVLTSSVPAKPAEALAASLRQLDRHMVQLDAFKEQVSDDIVDLRRVISGNQETARRMQDRAEQQLRDLRNR
jgi:hypothetical protein